MVCVFTAASSGVSWQGDQDDLGDVPHRSDDRGADVDAVLQ